MTEIKNLYDEYQADPLFTMRFNKLAPDKSGDDKYGLNNYQITAARLKHLEAIIA